MSLYIPILSHLTIKDTNISVASHPKSVASHPKSVASKPNFVASHPKSVAQNLLKAKQTKGLKTF